MKHQLRVGSIILLTSVLVADCGRICGCGPPPQAMYYIFYKSSSNSDLLQPQTGIYLSSNITIVEQVNKNGTVVETLAPKIDGQYVRSDGAQPAHYFIHYISSAIQNQKDLNRTLIQLSTGVTDTLTYSFTTNNSYPQQVFYNGKPVWKLGDSMEITIVK